jgi:N-acetylglucosamine-6-phosphate deacetylase
VTVLRAATVVTGAEVLAPGWLSVQDGRLTAPAIMHSGVPPEYAGVHDHGEVVDLGDSIVVPGFVDMHVHGGGGFAYTSPDPEEVLRAAAFHRAHGTTTTLASLVTATEANLTRSVRMLAELVADGAVAGIHLEGPWLNPARRGAHDPALLRPPDPAELHRLLAAGGGAIRMITIAPELPGGLVLIRETVAAGVVAAVGHTDADHDLTRAAIDAGATVATHLFNAMPPLHHREPGPIAALVNDPRVTLEMIADGVHQHPALLPLIAAAAGPDRIALVTDAMVAAGRPDGEYTMGPLAVTVTAGVARVSGDGSIAGGTTTMADLFRTAANGPPGAPPDLLAAVRQTANNPARALGLPEAGLLAAGLPADLVVLAPDLTIRSVLRGTGKPAR